MDLFVNDAATNGYLRRKMNIQLSVLIVKALTGIGQERKFSQIETEKVIRFSLLIFSFNNDSLKS